MSNLEKNSQEKLTERQICARIQHFYEIMKERKYLNESIMNPDLKKVEEELLILMEHMETIFGDIVYVD
jgi:guanylate kinase